MKMHSPDLSRKNVEKLTELFPNCVTETRDENGEPVSSIDFDLLRQELSDHIVEGLQERYQIDWPGKRKAMLVANSSVAKTLRPAREESVEFDTTKNLFIEGDNLAALKLIQETYLNKIKVIYIDPPYNTGKDFIFKDDYAEDLDSYLERSNQVDDEGNRLVGNTETNGRFHSDWLSMMYPRLKLARNLLRDDGVIFISIDDNEQANLRRLCDEVFGEKNFEGHIHWRRRTNQPNDSQKMIGLVAEHILAYAKNTAYFKSLGVGKVGLTGKFSNPDNDPRGEWASKPWKVGSDQTGSEYEITLPNGKVLKEEWMGDKDTYLNLLKDNRIIFPKNNKGFPRKKYFKFEREQEGQSATNWWPDEEFGSNQEGSKELAALMDGTKNMFKNPKPTKLLRNLFYISNCKFGDIVLDFFAGTGTTAQAVMQLNAEDGGKRQCISVQLPELTKTDSEAYKAGYKNIAEISKERIRRAGEKIKKENPDADLDIGFRVLKVDTSNMEDVYYFPDDIEQADLLDNINNIKLDRTAEDLLFQVLLDWGVDLTLPIAKENIHGKSVYFVDDNALVACFEQDIDEALVKELAQRHPMRVVFRDNGFASDAVKINITQIFKLMSPDTDVRVI